MSMDYGGREPRSERSGFIRSHPGSSSPSCLLVSPDYCSCCSLCKFAHIPSCSFILLLRSSPRPSAFQVFPWARYCGEPLLRWLLPLRLGHCIGYRNFYGCMTCWGIQPSPSSLKIRFYTPPTSSTLCIRETSECVCPWRSLR